MKLVPVTLQDFPHLEPVEWTFKKQHVRGKVKKKEEKYYYELDHPSMGNKCSLDEEKVYETKEDARDAAENYIDLWYSLNGRILALR